MESQAVHFRINFAEYTTVIDAPTHKEAVAIVKHYLRLLSVDDAEITRVDDEPIPDERPYEVWDGEPPAEDDSLPSWADYYPNESDYWKENRP